MAMRGRPTPALALTDHERESLERWSRRRKTAQALALRSRIVLQCAEGHSNRRVAAYQGVTVQTVGKWRTRFVVDRLDGLADAPRSGAPCTVTDDLVEKVVTMTLEEKPRGATHWSTRTLASKVGLSHNTVSAIWRTFCLQPHREDGFVLSTDPLFIEKVRDVVGLYLSPPENALVLCVDEKSQIQALNRSQPIFPMIPGTPTRRSWDYRRHGTTSLFAALSVVTGRVIGKTYRRHRAIEFKKFLAHIDNEVPCDLDVHLILDNYATHKAPPVHRWLVRHPRFHLHFIPTHSSWLNLVERWFAELTRRALQRGTHCSVPQLEGAVKQWLDTWNDDPRPFVWTKSADQILASISKYLQRTSVTGH